MQRESCSGGTQQGKWRKFLRVLEEEIEFHKCISESISLILFIMRYNNYSQVQNWKKELVRKIGLFGLSDLRKLAPIGDLGYANGWTPIFSDDPSGFMYGEMESSILKAFREQGFMFDKGYSSGYRGTDHHYICTELCLRYSVDSGD